MRFEFGHYNHLAMTWASWSFDPVYMNLCICIYIYIYIYICIYICKHQETTSKFLSFQLHNTLLQIVMSRRGRLKLKPRFS